MNWKFRAWDKKINRMWNWTETKRLSVAFQNSNMMIWPLDSFIQNDRFILMAFTGLLDKNGKEIWEGDILRTPQDEIGNVVFSQGSFWMKFLPPYDWDVMVPAILLDDINFEVIGNIHENSDLLSPGGRGLGRLPDNKAMTS